MLQYIIQMIPAKKAVEEYNKRQDDKKNSKKQMEESLEWIVKKQKCENELENLLEKFNVEIMKSGNDTKNNCMQFNILGNYDPFTVELFEKKLKDNNYTGSVIHHTAAGYINITVCLK